MRNRVAGMGPELSEIEPGNTYAPDFDRAARLMRRALTVWGALTFDQLLRALGIAKGTPAQRSLSGKIGARNGSAVAKDAAGRWALTRAADGYYAPGISRAVPTPAAIATVRAVARKGVGK